MKVIFASHSFMGDTFRVGSHHYAREFARLGDDVLHISTSLWRGMALARPATRASSRHTRAIEGPLRDSDGVLHAVPRSALPMRWGGGLTSANRIIERTGFRQADLLIIDQPHYGLLGELLPAAKVIYRPTDEHPSGRLARDEQRVVTAAHGIVATSRPVLEALHSPPGTPQSVIENGVEFERFASEPGGVRDGLVYVGAIDGRFAWTDVAIIANAAPSEVLRLVGPVTDPPERALPSNVEIVGPLDYVKIPEILRRSRLGIVPMSNDPRNAGRSPMKYYEYLAAGLYVVATRTPSLADRSTPGVFTYSHDEEIAPLVRKALSSDAPNAAGMVAAREQDWSRKAVQLRDFAQSLS